MEETTTVKKYPPKGILAAIGCTVALTCGPATATAINVVIPQLVIAMDASLVQIALRSTLATIVAFLCGLIGTKVIPLITPRLLMILGPLIGGGALIWSSQTTSIFQFILTGIPAGIAMSLCAYTCVAAICNDWFGRNSGKIFGVVSGVQVVLVSVMFNVIGRLLTAFNDYHVALLYVGLFTIIFGFLVAVLCIRKLDNTAIGLQEREAAARRKAAGEEPDEGEREQTEGVMLKSGFKTAALWLLIICVFFGGINITGMNSYLTTIFQGSGVSPGEAAVWLSYWTFAGGVTMLISGYLQKATNSRVLVCCIFGGYVIGCIMLSVWLGNGTPMLAIAAACVLACIKPITLIPGLCIPDIFGKKDYVAFNSLSVGCYYGGIAVCMILIAAIIQNFGPQAAIITQVVFACIALPAILIALKLSPYKKMTAARQEALKAEEAKE